MIKSILITGCSSGLGFALANLYLDEGFIVYGISRNRPKITNKNFIFKSYDLSKIKEIKDNLTNFIKDIQNLQLVFLNAGTLGKIAPMSDLSQEEIYEVMNLNVYSNKELLDIILQKKPKTIIATSSGAASKGSFGWGAYCLSKSNLNMLIDLYSKEMLETTLLAVAPGVIKTPMTDIIRFKVDEKKFPSAKILKEGYLQTPKEAAIRFSEVTKRALEFESGSFIDVREI